MSRSFANLKAFNIYYSSLVLGISMVLTSQTSLFAQSPVQKEDSPSKLGNLADKYSGSKKLKPGVFLKERQALYAKIELAEKSGVGVKNYLTAFKYVESMVESGAREEDIARRMDSISNGLEEQFKRSRILKIQKLPPPIAASSPPPSAVHRRSKKKRSRFSNTNNGDLVNKIKDKWFGGDIPDSIKKQIPPGIDPNKLNKNDLDRLMKRLGK